VGVDRLLAAALPAFLALHARLRVQVLVSNRRIDLIEEGVDVAIRVRERLDTDADLQVKMISRTGLLLAASPGFVAAYGQPSEPAELAAFPTLSLTDRPGADRWVLTNDAGEAREVLHEPRVSASAFPILRQAATDGLGIGLMPEYACRELFAEGKLVPILPEWRLPQGILHLVFTSRRGQLPGVRAVIDFAAEALHPRSPAWAFAD
jgi:DNA-binding transcriptional LysR family regulator